MTRRNLSFGFAFVAALLKQFVNVRVTDGRAIITEAMTIGTSEGCVRGFHDHRRANRDWRE